MGVRFRLDASAKNRQLLLTGDYTHNPVGIPTLKFTTPVNECNGDFTSTIQHFGSVSEQLPVFPDSSA